MNRLFSRLMSLVLVASIFLVGCSSTPFAASKLFTNYNQETLAVVENLRVAVDVPADDAGQATTQAQALDQINEYVARYRRQSKISSLASFMTMATALNGLAGHYNAYPNRPVPDKLKERLTQEFKQVELALKREAAT